MMVVRCENCGREEVWTTGVVLGEAEIEVCGSCVCRSCGTVISDANGVLREFRISVDRVEQEYK
jgi:ribosome-binding protein aMBF1 (putative translation factor)